MNSVASIEKPVVLRDEQVDEEAPPSDFEDETVVSDDSLAEKQPVNHSSKRRVILYGAILLVLMIGACLGVGLTVLNKHPNSQKLSRFGKQNASSQKDAQRQVEVSPFSMSTKTEPDSHRNLLRCNEDAFPPLPEGGVHDFVCLKNRNRERVKRVLERRYPEATIEVVPNDWGTTMDFDDNRIRIFYDTSNDTTTQVISG